MSPVEDHTLKQVCIAIRLEERLAEKLAAAKEPGVHSTTCAEAAKQLMQTKLDCGWILTTTRPSSGIVGTGTGARPAELTPGQWAHRHARPQQQSELLLA